MQLSVAINENNDDFVDYIESRFSNTTELNNLLINKDDRSASIVFSVVDKECQHKAVKPYEQNETLIAYVSCILADYIVRKYELKLIFRVINTNYCYFNNAEKKEIYKEVCTILRNEDITLMSSLFRMKSRNIIAKKLMDYFANSNSIILDGFVNFRLKDYIVSLEEIVDKAVDKFLTDREYKEFIRLLRYFVDIQEPRYAMVHVVPVEDGKYILYDPKKNEITAECTCELLDDIHDAEIGYDDMLISSLITLAPLKITIHRPEAFINAELLETIKNVFIGKIMLCSKCELCGNSTCGK